MNALLTFASSRKIAGVPNCGNGWPITSCDGIHRQKLFCEI
jgi:hypothetical protein